MFALDSCDRKVMAWCATIGGISGEIVRDLMGESIEKRFGTAHAPLQWLSDNGSCYRANESIDFAIQLGLVPALCRSAARSRTAWPKLSSIRSSVLCVCSRPS